MLFGNFQLIADYLTAVFPTPTPTPTQRVFLKQMEVRAQASTFRARDYLTAVFPTPTPPPT